MSLFEDLVEELKDENLLETTVIESLNADGSETGGIAEDRSDPVESDEGIPAARADQLQDESLTEPDSDPADSVEEPDLEIKGHDFDVDAPAFPEADEVNETSAAVSPGETGREYPRNNAFRESRPLAQKHEGETGKQFFRRRATDEVRGLHMVDHIITRVEKEQAKINAAPYDDLNVKQSLHKFLKLDEEANASEVAEIEFMLLQETENWYSALSLRDKQITVENLRSYCESTIPTLSGQALLALARFYRNSPYSELVRSKFDLIITKLYTADAGDGKREMILPPDQLAEDIQRLYAEWSSVELYSSEEDEADLQFGMIGFRDFMEESEKAENFDELVSRDFFRRLNDFKQKAGESFFAPPVVVAAVKCNVAVGNRYIDLLKKEKGNKSPEELCDQYGFLSDSAIAEAVRKLFSDEEEEKEKEKERKAKEEKRKIRQVQKETEDLFDLRRFKRASRVTREKVEWYHANKKLVIATALSVLLGFGYFFLSNYLFPSGESSVSRDVQIVNLEDTALKEYVTSARISKNTMYAVTSKSWKKMDREAKEDVMRKFLAVGREKGFIQVNFIDSNGKRVGFVSQSALSIMD